MEWLRHTRFLYESKTRYIGRRDEILSYISDNYSKVEIARELDCKMPTLERYLRKLGIEYHGNQGGKGRKTDPKRKPALEFIHSNASNSAKRNRLIDDGIKEFNVNVVV